MLACGNAQTLVLTRDGMVWTFGCTSMGTLGNADDNTFTLVPTLIDEVSFSQQKIIMLSAGAFHSMALEENCDVYTWGQGSSGVLGHNDTCSSKNQK